MKSIKHLILFVGILLFTSCQKKEVLHPNFDVSTEIPFWSGNHSVKINTPIIFLFDGSADLITFYSGELNKEYQFKDRVQTVNGTPTTRDKGFAIKGFSENSPASFTYTYPTPGTYTATFVGTNRSVYGEPKTIVVNLKIIVTP